MKTTKHTQQSRRWTWVASAALLAVVVLVGVLVVVTTGGSTNDSPRPSAQPPTQQPSTPPQSEPPETPEGDQSIPESAPQSQWDLFEGIAMPTHPEAGPHQQHGGVAKDYQRSPVGALHAAWQIQGRYLLGEDWRAVVDQQVLDGPGKQVYLQARAQDPGPLTSEQKAQVAGFRFVTYTKDIAVIQFAAKAPEGGLGGTTATVRWSEGDWKLELQPNGAASPTVQPLDDLTFYTPWSGV